MASKEDEDLEFNKFYTALQSKFRRLFEAAQHKCYVICVPVNDSLEGLIIDLSFVETHLLKPSPYFKGEYFTTHLSNNKTVTLEDGYLLTGEGFPTNERIQILAHEHGYNTEFKPYQIYIIERPIGSPQKKIELRKSPSASSVKNILPPSHSYIEQLKFLNTFKEYKLALVHLDTLIQQFLKNYLVLPGYMEDAAAKIQIICCDAAQYLLSRNKHPLRTDHRVKEAIYTASDCYIMKGVHEKLFPVVCTANQISDNKLLEKIKLLSGVTGEQLGVREDFCCPLPAAKVELANINGFKTPLEKLVCLKTTLDLITEGIQVHIMDRRTPLDGSVPCLASDDLLPIVVTVIVEAKCTLLTSNIFYIENFHFTKSSVDDLSFSLVTFRAAVNYLLNTDFSYLKESTKQQSDQSEQSSVLVSVKSMAHENGTESSSRFDRKLESLVRRLETSTSELGSLKENGALPQPKPLRGGRFVSSSHAVPANVIPLQDTSQRKNQLGDFLSALQSDAFSSSYGKQT